jgi:CRP-like cAMP-binding protein
MSNSQNQVRSSSSFTAGQRIYAAGAPGLAWRVVSGSVRLDRPAEEGAPMFANLAVTGDVIGAETLMFQHYTFEATALANCTLAPWPEGDQVPAGESLLATLAASEQRAADVVALRCGQAVDRVRRLLQMLTGNRSGDERTPLPSRRDMADITALTVETVSRTVSALRREGEVRDGRRSHRNAAESVGDHFNDKTAFAS